MEGRTLASQIYGKSDGWREGHWLHRFIIIGVAREVTLICARLVIENVNVAAVNKAAFKGIVKAGCRSEDNLSIYGKERENQRVGRRRLQHEEVCV